MPAIGKRPDAVCKKRTWEYKPGKHVDMGCGSVMIYKDHTENLRLPVYMCPNCD